MSKPLSIREISEDVFERMGAPQEFSSILFGEKFREELAERKLGRDRAQYCYLYGQVIRRVHRFIKHPPVKKKTRLKQERRYQNWKVMWPDFKKLAANDNTDRDEPERSLAPLPS